MKRVIDSSRFDFDQNIKKEYKLKTISGSDEAGRGAMAGPIVVATVILKENYFNHLINDSKKVPEKIRYKIYDEIIKNSISYSIKVYDNFFVDINNPKKTSKIGMIETIKELVLKPDLCILDAEKIEIDLKTLSLIKGDTKSQSVAAASILAKVTRDLIMIEFGKQYPSYGFEKHKGYCTKSHIDSLKKNGVLNIYRKTYKPVKNILEELQDEIW